MSKRSNHDGRAEHREKKREIKTPDLKRVNFNVQEIWTVDCPFCGNEQDAPLDLNAPMQPKAMDCEECSKTFICTYDRD